MSSTSKPRLPILPPTADDYLESLDDQAPIIIDNLDQFLNSIINKTHLNDETVKIICRRFFQEIRNSLLRNKVILIRGLGRFSIENPNTNTKKKIFIKFKPAKSLRRRMNGKF